MTNLSIRRPVPSPDIVRNKDWGRETYLLVKSCYHVLSIDLCVSTYLHISICIYICVCVLDCIHDYTYAKCT